MSDSSKRERAIFWLRWMLLPVVIAAVFIWSYYSTEFLAKRVLPRRWIEPLAYFQTCLLGGLAAGWCIPRWKTMTILLLAIPVVAAGWQMTAWFDPITQQPTILPFASGFLGGTLGLVIVGGWEYHHRRRLLADPPSGIGQNSGNAGR